MNVKVETCYGNVTLRYCYDCNSITNFYDAYDENGNHLGEIWNIPYFDEDDSDTMDCLIVAVETAIECNDICTPKIKEPEINKVFLLTVLEKIGNAATAQSHALSNMDKCIELKVNTVENFVSGLVKLGIKYKISDTDFICEVESDDKARHLCVTMKEVEVQ